MRKFLLTAVLGLVAAGVCEARPRLFARFAPAPRPACQPAPAPSYAPAYRPAPMPASGGGIAQRKAEAQARAGRCFHPGGPIAGTHEGCGFSSVSADDAIRHCCYWGRLPATDVGVARGPGGWYATVQYGGRGPVRTAAGGTFQAVGSAIHQTGSLVLPHTTRVRPAWGTPAPAAAEYPPIRLNVPLPTCPNGSCGR